MEPTMSIINGGRKTTRIHLPPVSFSRSLVSALNMSVPRQKIIAAYHLIWLRKIETQRYKLIPSIKEGHMPIRSHKKATVQIYKIHGGTT